MLRRYHFCHVEQLLRSELTARGEAAGSGDHFDGAVVPCGSEERSKPSAPGAGKLWRTLFSAEAVKEIEGLPSLKRLR